MLSIDETMPVGHGAESHDLNDLAFGEVAFTPAPGWTVLSINPLRREGGRPSGWVELADDAVSMSVRTRRFDGSAETLLEEIVGEPDSSSSWLLAPPDRRPVLNRDGVRGVIEYRTGSGEEYVCAAFVLRIDSVAPGGLGVEFVAEGYEGTLAARAAVVHEMISSLRC